MAKATPSWMSKGTVTPIAPVSDKPSWMTKGTIAPLYNTENDLGLQGKPEAPVTYNTPTEINEPDATNPEYEQAITNGAPNRMQAAIQARNNQALADKAEISYSPTEQRGLYSLGKSGKDLPTPSADMYDRAPDYESAKRLYEAYTKSGNAGESLSGPTYNNTVIPVPEPNLLSEGSDVGVAQKIGFGVRGAIKETLLTSAAILDDLARGMPEPSKGPLVAQAPNRMLAGQKQGQLEQERSEFARENPSNLLVYKADQAMADRPGSKKLMDQLVINGTETATGFMASLLVPAGPVAQGTSMAAKVLPMAAKAASAAVGIIGSAVTTASNTETVATDFLDNAGILKGVPINPNGTLDEQFLQKKLRLIEDAFVTTAIGGAAVGTVKTVASPFKIPIAFLIDSIKPTVNKTNLENAAIKKLIAALDLNPDDPKTLAELQKVVRENKDILVNFANRTIDNVDLKRTTFSAINEGVSKAPTELLPANVANKAMEVEKNITAIKQGAPTLETVISEPTKKLGKSMTQGVETFGGKTGIEASRQAIVSDVKNLEAGLTSRLARQSARIADTEKFIGDRLKSDPLFGKDIQRLMERNGINPGVVKTENTKIVMNNLRTAVDNMRTVRDNLYDAVPDGIKIDEKSFLAAVEDAYDYLPSSTKNTLKLTQTKTSARDQAEALFTKGAKTEAAPTLDFRTVAIDIKKQINDKLNRLYQAGSVDDVQIDALKGVLRNIDREQVEFVTKNSPEAAKVFSIANGYYKDDWAKFSNKDNPISELFDGTIRDEFKKLDIEQSVSTALKDSKLGTSKAVVELLRRPEASGNPSDIVKIHLGDAIENMSSKLADGDLTKINADDIINSVKKAGGILEENFPEESQLMNQLVDDLRVAGKDLVKQKEVLQKWTTESNELKNKMYSSILGKFIDKDGNQATDGFAVLSRIFDDPTGSNVEQFSKIVRRVNSSKDPVAQDGLKAAYLQHIRNLVLDIRGQGVNAGMDKVVNSDTLVKYGEMIFGKNTQDDTVGGYMAIINFVKGEENKRFKVASKEGIAPAFLRSRAYRATSAALNFMTRPLSHIGSIQRTAARVGLEASGMDNKVAVIIDKFAADPDEAIRLIEQLSKTIKKPNSKEVRKVAFNTMLRLSLVLPEDEAEFNKSYEENVKRSLLGDKYVPEAVEKTKK